MPLEALRVADANDETVISTASVLGAVYALAAEQEARLYTSSP
jgi:hypothetical protein